MRERERERKFSRESRAKESLLFVQRQRKRSQVEVVNCVSSPAVIGEWQWFIHFIPDQRGKVKLIGLELTGKQWKGFPLP